MKLFTKALFAGAALSAGMAHADNADPLNLGRMTAGYSYFNRPGATVAMVNADLVSCVSAVADLHSFQDSLRGGAAGFLGALIANAQADSANRGVGAAGIENCMIVHGWRVVRLDDAEGKALSTLPADTLAQKLAPWVGADMPHGDVVREWHNDAALGTVNHFSLHAQHTKNGLLSVLAMKADASSLSAESPVAAPPAPGKIKLDPQWPRRPLQPEMLDQAPAGSAIVVVNIKGVSLRQGNGFVFSREGSNPSIEPSRIDRAPDTVAALVGAFSGSAGGKFMAFALPPGRWRIRSIINGGIELNFCLGSPAFDAGADDVVYAGQLDLKQDHLEPDLALAPVKAWMGGALAAARLRPAAYTNGSRAMCQGTNIYALEFDGAPFEPGYALGSRVPPIVPAK